MKEVNKENMKYILEELDKPFCVALLSMVSKFKVAILSWFLVSSAQIILGMVSLSHGISWLHTHHCISGRLIVAMMTLHRLNLVNKEKNLLDNKI